MGKRSFRRVQSSKYPDSSGNDNKGVLGTVCGGGKQTQSRKEGSNSYSDMPNPGSRDSIVLWGDGCSQSALRTKE
ncbi:hypothetical protein CEXT_804721 [Caerostris extrusa]|uniref:Uncharacterized protein n=1 Tax=Caerostris extrusa TaxID=172846 RepID=A0AAV4XYB8_CAEEX|nr:hypothetical protein CEXT_804721 [Caerostris extrusa]